MGVVFAGLLVGGVLGPTACSRAPSDVPKGANPQDAARVVDAAPDALYPSGPTFPAVLPKGVAAWTDPAAVDVLAIDCRAEPWTERGVANGPALLPTQHALSCSLGFDQSCVYSPCFSKNEDCRGECTGSCRTCDEGCITTCDGCKVGCKDEACKKACAEKTGACRQACLSKRDHCATAECAEKERTCDVEEKRKWRSHKCSCRAIHPCLAACFAAKERCSERCVTSKDDMCWEKCENPKCKDACAARFRGCDVDYCALEAIEPFSDGP